MLLATFLTALNTPLAADLTPLAMPEQISLPQLMAVEPMLLMPFHTDEAQLDTKDNKKQFLYSSEARKNEE